jgi:hypothetical protein
MDMPPPPIVDKTLTMCFWYIDPIFFFGCEIQNYTAEPTLNHFATNATTCINMVQSAAYMLCWYDDETAYTLDTYPGHSLDTCDISIDFLMHFRSIFDYLDILWFILTSWCTSNIACWSHSHCDILPIALQHASPIPSFLPLAYHITGDWGIFAYITQP